VPTYSLGNASAWLKAVSKGMEDAARRGLYSAAIRTVSYIQNDVIPATTPLPVARGVYRAGWRADKTANGAVVLNSAPHAAFVEYGVRGGNVKIGRAMIAALADWVRMKGIGGSVVTTKGGRKKLVRATQSEAERIAWAIAKSMQKKGIFAGGQGLGVLKRAGAMIPTFIREEVRAELAREGGGA
jgi:hypothetical protein